jgi:hypothetical protein
VRLHRSGRRGVVDRAGGRRRRARVSPDLSPRRAMIKQQRRSLAAVHCTGRLNLPSRAASRKAWAPCAQTRCTKRPDRMPCYLSLRLGSVYSFTWRASRSKGDAPAAGLPGHPPCCAYQAVCVCGMQIFPDEPVHLGMSRLGGWGDGVAPEFARLHPRPPARPRRRPCLGMCLLCKCGAVSLAPQAMHNLPERL